MISLLGKAGMNDVGSPCDNPKCGKWVEDLKAQCPYCGDFNYCDVVCLKAARKYHLEACEFSKMQLQEHIRRTRDPENVVISKIQREVVFQQKLLESYIDSISYGKKGLGCMAWWLNSKEEAKVLVTRGKRLDPSWFCHVPKESINNRDPYMRSLKEMIKVHNPSLREVVVVVIYQPDRNDPYKDVYPLLLQVPPDTSRKPMDKK